MSTIQELIKSDRQRMEVLRAVASLELPDGYVAAGFVRNLVWDQLHGFADTPLNDVDVIYYDVSEKLVPEHIHHQLAKLLPDVNWEVKNQAIMHRRNGDKPYTSSTDAMTYWPEKETAIGVRLSECGELKISAPFGTRSLFAGYITFNPKCSKSVFIERVKAKGWVQQWPQLRVVS